MKETNFKYAYFKLSIYAIVIGCAFLFSKVDDSSERYKRKNEFESAKSQFTNLIRYWNYITGDGEFKNKIEELNQIKLNYKQIPNQYNSEIQKLQARLRENQLQKYLKSHFIIDHQIKYIGTARQSILSSFNIETASDITWDSVINIKGFGVKYTTELINWRKRIENQFVFDSSKGIDPNDIAILKIKFTKRKNELQNALLAGPEILSNIKASIPKYKKELKKKIIDSAKKRDQAEADLAILG